jgi:DtxR family transcriptional regulator, Mn-dependent transcriptional regulator
MKDARRGEGGRGDGWLRWCGVPEGFHPPIEEYLKTVYELEEAGVPALRARLAERLHHTPPAVTEMVRRLIDEGYLEGTGRSLRMTEQGRRRAESVVRKHRLAERLLTDILGLEWYKTHREAARWEHVISDEVDQRIVALLQNPESCPHGNPIPGSGAPRPVLRALAGAEPGQQVRLGRVSETVELDLDALVYLDTHGFRPGAKAEVKERAQDGTLTLDVDGATIAIDPALAAQLYVDVA